MPHRRSRPLPLALVAVATALVLVACSDTGESTDGGSPSATVTPSPTDTSSPVATVNPRVSGTVADDLEAPWGLAFLPDGTPLVSQRDSGSVVRVADGEVVPVGTVPGVVAGGEGGLLGIAVAPTFARDRWLYAYLTAQADNRVVRMKYDNDRLGAPQVVLSGIEKASIHDGGRIAFGPDGHLYVGTGDAGRTELSQDLSSKNGKILRVTADGDPAPGNPFPDSPVYSYGHRNVQGLAWDSKDRLWAAEFGQNTWDELNLIRKGGNYGWPLVEGGAKDRRFVDPVRQWATEVASPSGITIIDDTVILAGLRGQRLWTMPITADGVGPDEAYLVGSQGRLRTVAQAPDGSLWVVTSNTDGRGDAKRGDDRILRVLL